MTTIAQEIWAVAIRTLVMREGMQLACNQQTHLPMFVGGIGEIHNHILDMFDNHYALENHYARVYCSQCVPWSATPPFPFGFRFKVWLEMVLESFLNVCPTQINWLQVFPDGLMDDIVPKNISNCTVSYTALPMQTDLHYQPTLS